MPGQRKSYGKRAAGAKKSAARNLAKNTQPPQADSVDKGPFQCRVVGIGASAGGLEALRELMVSLPATGDLCYVIAQHVSPTHVSMLMNLLAPMTSLVVCDLKDHQEPSMGTVYITPPNKDVVMKNGVLRLTEPQQAIGPKPSVNHFFQSLASELGDQAIGIILSGTGSDGASGLKAIKAVGGITIAQEPDSAKYDGMPKAAIHTGSVDLILRPADMGAALDRLVIQHQNLQLVIAHEPEADEYTQINNIVRLNSGFRLSDYKAATVRRRIARRMSILGIKFLTDYIERLRKDKEESLALVRDTFISVTAFFRDTSAFLALELVVREIIQNKDEGGVIRCWVPGCATGEEAYSLAMIFEEALRDLERNDLQYMIFASDLDNDALEQARSGLYPHSDLEMVPRILRDRYTEVVGAYCRVTKSLRNRLVFARQNVIEDPPFARLDLISCRNLMIYFTAPVQKRVLEVFHYSLNEGGCLFLGKSETGDARKDLFEPKDNRSRIYRRQSGMTHYSLPINQSVPKSLGNRDGNRNMTTSTDLVTMRTLEGLAKRYAPPSIVINDADNVVHFHGNLKPYMDFPSGRADMYLFDLLDSNIRAELRALVYRCRRELGYVEGSPWHLDIDGKRHVVTLSVSPLESEQRQSLLVSFQTKVMDESAVKDRRVKDAEGSLIISELEQEIANTRTHLNIVVEELQASNEELQSLNEELQSTNEELQSTNEELQTSNEELQSTNEELLTVNEEMQVKSAELEATADDLINVKQSLSFPLIVVDTKLRITQANDACEHVVALDGPLEHSSFNTVQWRVQLPGLARQLRQVIETGEQYQEPVFADQGGVYRLHIMPYRTAREEVAGAVLLFEDVTAQYNAEQALKISHDRFEMAVRGSSDGIWDRHISSNEFYWSPRFKEIMGYEDGEIEADYDWWVSNIHSDDQEAVLDVLEGCLNGNVPYDIEYRMLHKSGNYVWVRTRGKVLVRDEGGQPLRMAGFISNISERKQAEQELQDSAQRMRLAAETTGVGIWEWNIEDNSALWDEQMFKIYGISPTTDNKMTYGDWRNVVFAEDLADQEKALQETIDRQSRGQRQFRIHRCNDGAERVIQSVETVRTDEQGRVVWVIGTNIDVTEQQQAAEALRESKERFQHALRYAATGKALVAPDGRWLEVNPSLCEIVGYSEEELLARDLKSITHPDDVDADLELFKQIQAGTIDNYQVDKRCLHKQGHIVWAQLNVSLARNPSGEPLYYIFQIQDVTQRRQYEEELRLAANVFDNTLDGIIITSQDGNIIKVNRAFEQITGYSSEEVVGRSTRMLRSERHDAQFYDDMWRSVNEQGGWQGEIWDRHKQGHVIPLWLSISSLRDDDGEVQRYIATMYDISEQKMSQERVHRLAHYDMQTNLPNRTLFMERLDHALSRAKRQKTSLALMFIDLDNFKDVNDSYGHPVGDELLRQVGNRLRKVTRASDTVARLSGDEFMLLVESVLSMSNVQMTAEKILNMLAKPFELGGTKCYVTASLGVALYPDDGEDKDTLVKYADLAMYRSKNKGRNQYHFYTHEMSKLAHERMSLQNDLRLALNQKCLELHLQPIVDVVTRRCAGVEALLRWRHPERDWIPPQKFVALAEENSLIHPLGEWVLYTACRQMKAWLEAGIGLDFIAVNVSGKQIATGEFVTLAKQVLKATQCPADRIILELTENFVMRESEGAIDKLNALRDLGFGIAIDDFGTGYSSLAYLKRLPVTKLKLDQSFVRDIPTDANDMAIARSILRLGDTLRLEVVAEGAETEEQHEFVRSEGCTWSQGFLYARPMPAESFEEYISA